MNIRDRMKQFSSFSRRAEREKLFHEERRIFWRRYIKIMLPLWVILAIELIALWYVKTH